MTTPALSPPANLDAEIAVLSAALQDADAWRLACTLLVPEDFYAEPHRCMFRAMAALAGAGQPIDPITLSAHLLATDELTATGGKEFIGFLIDAVPTAAHAAYHAGLVRDASRRRQLVHALQQIVAQADDRRVPLRELAGDALQHLLPLATDAQGPGYRAAADLVYPAVAEIEARQSGARGLPTGYDAIDSQTCGFRRGELVVIGGAEKSGKSVLALNVALHAARDGHGVAYVSAEMQQQSLMERALATVARVPIAGIAAGRLTADEWRRIGEAAGGLARAPLYVDDEAEPQLADIVARATHLKALHPEVELVIVDFLQLVRYRVADRSEATELKAIAYALKGLAKRLDVVVVAPCQVNTKEIEGGKNPRPQLRDLQGSSGMRQAADFVGLIYRPSLYSSLDDPETFEINFAACRRTERFTANLRWHGATMEVLG